MKRILSTILVLAMLLGLATPIVQAGTQTTVPENSSPVVFGNTEATTEGTNSVGKLNSNDITNVAATKNKSTTNSASDFEYYINDDNTVTITKYIGKSTDVVIPATIEGKPVTIIGNNFSEANKNIVSVVIPEGVISIGEYDIWGVSAQGDTGPFWDCSNLETVIIPDSVSVIGEFAFMHCINLKEIVLPKSLIKIDTAAFCYCQFDKIYYKGNSREWSGIDVRNYGDGNAILFNTDIIFLGDDESNAYDYLYSVNENTITINRYIGNSTDVVIPDTLDGLPVTSIGDSAFFNCNINSIKIPDSVTSIGIDAFAYCEELTSIELPNSITSLEKMVFFYCTGLKDITIPGSVTYIGENAFNYCNSLATVTYIGTKNEWTSIKIESPNDELLNANIIFDDNFVEIIDTSKKFTDVTDSWAKPGIDYVVSYGYMNGTGNGSTFSPSGTMSRSMIVTVLYRIAGQPSHSGNNPFTDVDTGWYYDAVLWAYENGIVTGTSATTFAPNGDVTREQMATFLYRFAKYMGYDVSKTNDISIFPDASKVGSWAYDALAWANAEGLITGAVVSGETVLNPQGAATREQVATILMRFCRAYL